MQNSTNGLNQTAATTGYKQVDYTPLHANTARPSLRDLLHSPDAKKTIVQSALSLLVMTPLMAVLLYLISRMKDSPLSLAWSFVISALVMAVALPALIYSMQAERQKIRKDAVLQSFLRKNGWVRIRGGSLKDGQTALIHRLLPVYHWRDGIQLSTDPVPLSIYNYTASRQKGAVRTAVYTTMSVFDKHSKSFVDTEHYDTFQYTVICCHLGTKVPNIVFDAHKNNSQGLFAQAEVQEWLRKKQRYQLNSEFHDSFDLYIPAEYERDALYFITPDVMAAMIDYGKDFDFELVDDYLYIFRPMHTELVSEPNIKLLIETGRYFDSIFNKCTLRYRDGRASTKGDIYDDGKRLEQTSIPDII
jgi:hypothetical protein